MKLYIDNLSFAYRSSPVLSDLSFHIEKQELLAILGPNGVGKSTLLKCINRLLEPLKGTIILGDQEVHNMSIGEIAKNIAYSSQKDNPSGITAYDMILLGRKPYLTWRGVQKSDYELVNTVIDRLELHDLAMRPVHEMSGGEIQKVCLARALVQEPEVLLLDEPTSALDIRNQLELLGLVREIVNSHDLISVIVLHDLNTALRYADKLIFLKNGTIHAAITPDQISESIIREVYGVESAIGSVGGFPVVYPISCVV